MIDRSLGLELASGPHCLNLGGTYDLKSTYKQFGLYRVLARTAVNKHGSKVPFWWVSTRCRMTNVLTTGEDEM